MTSMEQFQDKQQQRVQDRALLTTVLDSVSNRIAGGTRMQGADSYSVSDQIMAEEAGVIQDAYSVDDAWAEQTHIRTGNQAWGDHANGRIPMEELVGIGSGHYMRADAADAFSSMVSAAAKDGVNLSLISSYRDYDKQVEIWNDPHRTNVAAKPGTSNHGWGVAIDVSREARRWVQQNGEQFGFVWPNWARRADSYEPWHFNFIGAFRENPPVEAASASNQSYVNAVSAVTGERPE